MVYIAFFDGKKAAFRKNEWQAKRHFIPDQIWHITHRCHKREFLLKFSKDRHRYLQRMLGPISLEQLRGSHKYWIEKYLGMGRKPAKRSGPVVSP